MKLMKHIEISEADIKLAIRLYLTEHTNYLDYGEVIETISLDAKPFDSGPEWGTTYTVKANVAIHRSK